MAKPKPKDEAFFVQFGPGLMKILESELATLKTVLEGEKASPAPIEEPILPPSARRFVTQPVHGG